MPKIEILRCDLCGNEQRQDQDVYWAHRTAEINWKVPLDGGNGGDFKGLACTSCRARINGAIVKAVSEINGGLVKANESIPVS